MNMLRPDGIRVGSTIKDIRDPRTYAVIGAAMEVHRILGHGYLEAVYQEALAVELEDRKIPFHREVPLKIVYKNRLLNALYRPDFMCFGTLVVELKALVRIGGDEEAQLINYLKGTRQEVGLLLNFGSRSLEFRRFVFSGNQSAESAKSADPSVVA